MRTASGEPASWRRRHRLALILVPVAVFVIVVMVGAGVSRYFSSKVLVPDHSAWPQNVTVDGLSPGRIVLSRSRDTQRPGVYGLEWQAILSFNATEMGLPSFAADPVEWMIGARIDADWDSLDASRHPGDFHLPILLFHGTEDTVVPISTSNRFARELAGWVTYYRVPYAEHTEPGTSTRGFTNSGSPHSSHISPAD